MTFRKKKNLSSNNRPRRLFKPWASLSVGGKIWRLTWIIVCVLWVDTFLQVLLYKFHEPVFTPHILSCYTEQCQDPNIPLRYSRICVPIEEISPYMLKATVTAEDRNFLYHRGFNFKGLRRAYLSNKAAGHVVRGGSSISQQTAKNCFLPFDRSVFRKLAEAHYTFLIEMLWGKKRIMECYLNVIEFGTGIYGCEAASRYYFNHSAKTLSEEESIQLAAVISNPHSYKPNCHIEEYDHMVSLITTGYQKQEPVVWERIDRSALPPNKVKWGRGLFFFGKWWVIHEWRNIRSK